MIYNVNILDMTNKGLEITSMNIAVLASHGGSDLQGIFFLIILVQRNQEVIADIANGKITLG